MPGSCCNKPKPHGHGQASKPKPAGSTMSGETQSFALQSPLEQRAEKARERVNLTSRRRT